MGTGTDKRIKRTMRELIARHEEQADYCQSRAIQWTEKAEQHRRRAEKLRAEAQEASQ